jgi:uncharacterized membrane protein YphA (DoxX/SURF4 family)
MWLEKILLRLFSTFADGWPGTGLLLQRILTAVLLIRFGIMELSGASNSLAAVTQIIAAFAGALLLIGLWTPIVGTLIAVIELWLTATHLVDPWTCITVATLAATVAMIGPGAWSIDARLFGRKHIET